MKTRTYEGVQHGDWVRCTQCGAQMLLPRGADQCPECYGYDTLVWVDEDRQEMDTKHLDCLAPMRKLELQEYLSQDVLAIEHSEYYKQLIGEDEWCEDFMAGVEWRINSAWHDASETPQHSGMLIAIKQDGTPIVCGPNNSNWKIAVRIFHIVRWAYIEDLLPITC